MPNDRKFLCDEMLARLARWLRAAGYDTETAENGCGDEKILARARNEGRLILTRDGELPRRRGASNMVCLVKSETVDGQARELAAALGIDWLHNPFSRCMVDNQPLRPARKAEIEGLPEDTLNAPGPFNTCPECGRLYWPGSHVKRMIRKLEKWKLPE